MRWRVESSELKTALKKVTPFAGGHLPVTWGVRIEAAGDHLRLQCQNPDQQATTLVDAAVDQSGKVVVPARLFDAFVRSLNGAVAAEIRDESLIVTCGSTSLTLHTLKLEDWPKFGEPEGDGFDLTPHWPGIRRVLHAADLPTSKNNAVLKGFRFDEGAVVACNHHQLATFAIDGLDAAAVVPAPLLNQIDKAMGDHIAVTFGERVVGFSTDTTSWVTRQIEGDYPSWRGLIREKSDHTLTFNRAELAETLDRLKLIADDNGYRRLRFVRDGDKAIFTTVGAEHGEITDVIACGGDWADPFSAEIPYLCDLVDNATVDELTFEVQDAFKPLIVRDGDWIGLCMPVRPK